MPSDLESLAGFSRPILYTDELANKLVVRDKCLVGKSKTCKPYYEYTDQGLEPYISFERGRVKIKAGRIGAFAAKELAPHLNELTHRYVYGGTMGGQFPSSDAEANHDLHKVMISGYQSDRQIVTISVKNDRGVVPLSSVHTSMGRGDTPMGKSIVKGKSSLSSLAALKVADKEAEDTQSFLKKYGLIPEKEVVSMSRLYDRSTCELKASGVEVAKYGWLSMAIIPHTILRELTEHPEGNIPQLFLYDTLPFVQTNLETFFSAQKIAEASQLISTIDVLSSILKYHYGDKAHGGYDDQIILGMIPFAAYYLTSLQFLDKNYNIHLNLV